MSVIESLGSMYNFLLTPISSNSSPGQPGNGTARNTLISQAPPQPGTVPTALPDLPAPKAEIEAVLSRSWEHYKKVMIDKDGRPLADPDDGDIDGDKDTKERVTVSEAVSYVLLRAVWMKDKEAFDKTWNWAEKNMQRKNLKAIYYWNKQKWVESPKKDHLFAWRYVPTLKGREGGVIHYDWMGESVWRGGLEGASDADLDIAASLVFASRLWNNTSYSEKAKTIINDIWEKYVNKVGDHYYIYGGDQFKTMGEVNPSYMRPSYYRMFAEVDPSHPWQKLNQSSYRVVIESGDISLHDEKGKAYAGRVNLPPNWIDIQPNGTFTDSDIFANQGGQLFGWDAFRTLFWVAEDYAWFARPEARRYLTDNSCSKKDFGPYCFLNRELTRNGKVMAGYSHDGTAVAPSGWWSKSLNKEQFAMNGAYLAYFYFAGNKKAAKTIYNNLQSTYHQEGYWGDEPNNYYGQNWAWFGLALISGKAANFFKPGEIKVTPTPAPAE